jgi:hypothetical protein
MATRQTRVDQALRTVWMFWMATVAVLMPVDFTPAPPLALQTLFR